MFSLYYGAFLLTACESGPKNPSAESESPTNEAPSDSDTEADEPSDTNDSLDTTEPTDEPDSGASTDSGLPETGEIEGWELLWRDEFSNDSIDLSKWQFEINGQGGGNAELQYYTDRTDNAWVESGSLIIQANAETYTGPDGTRNYTSARLRTKYQGDWQYGRFEARIKLPEGQGIWPAFWMLPTDFAYGTWPASGEIDIMEMVGHAPNVVHGTLHYGGIYPEHVYTGESHTNPQSFSESYHTFAVEWEAGVVRWYIDGNLTQTQTNWYTTAADFPAPFDQRFHLLLNVAVGGNWPGAPDSTTSFPQQMAIDYVRVYQRPGSEEPDPPESTLSLENSGFESVSNNGMFDIPSGWLVYPNYVTNYLSELSGSPIYNSGESFTAHVGSRSLKMFGQFTGSENRTAVYQEFSALPGENHQLTVQAYSHSDDAIAGNNKAVVSIKYFDSFYNLLAEFDSAALSANSQFSVWTELQCSGTAPNGTSIVQAVMKFVQCEGVSSGQCYDGGSVYFDAALFEGP